MTRQQTIELEVNGVRYHETVSSRMTLADFLREKLRLTGTHLGCEHGVCGVCTVQVDKAAVRSCLMLAVQADGTSVSTVEGLSSESGDLCPLQKAFSSRHALQCGFCTSGVLMSLDEYLRDTPDPDEGSVRTALSGNLCRCTGYSGMVKAALDVAAGTEPAPAVTRPEQYIGARMPRKEDPRLLTGKGTFVADFSPPGTVHAAFVRSTVAHARIKHIDTAAAAALPGVVGVFTAAELPERTYRRPMLTLMPNPAIVKPFNQQALAADEVCYVGESVAVVVADDPYIAEDAAELVRVDYEELPVVSGIDAALAASAVAHEGTTDNIGALVNVAYGDVAEAFEKADHITRAALNVNRGSGQPMETRGVLAVPDVVTGRLTVYTASQSPHLVKRTIMDMLGIDAEEIVVIAPPDVGGGFGPKVVVYTEDMVIAAVSRVLGLPVRWIEDRREHFMSTTHERDQAWNVELALTSEGRILGIRGDMQHDAGAYFPWGIVTPYISSTTMPGPYRIPAYLLHVDVLLTNTVPTSPVRGAGRPQAVFAMERLLDHAAQELGMDRAEIRRRNLVPADAMPYEVGLVFRDGKPIVYDSGDYPETLEAGLRRIDWDGFEARREAALAEGRLRGIGLAMYVEGTGLGPFEGSSVRVDRDGKVTVHTAAAPQGQSHQTTLAQVVADGLGVDIANVNVRTGDTSAAPIGVGTFASRVMVNAGSSAMMAAAEVREQALSIAAEVLDLKASELEIVNGVVQPIDGEGPSMPLADVAALADGIPGMSVSDKPAGLFANSAYLPPQATYANGAHFTEVEVDPDTGAVKILEYVIVHDCGVAVNPMVVDGQIQGGLAHGIGNAFLEETLYDENAQPITTTYMDYLMPEAVDVPEATLVHLESPSPLNPLGAKGAGEGGTIPAPAALVSAVEDALRQWRPRIDHHPLKPSAISEIASGTRDPSP